MDQQLELNITRPRTIFSVTDITNTLKRIIQQNPLLQNVWVRGQISNLSRPNSGHIYFSLKDEKSSIRGIIWRSNASRLKFNLQDGDEVLVNGQISIYAASSEYQINISKVEPIGIGSLQKAFEQLKQKLSDEGLFDESHKKPIPPFPSKIGVITSETGAAIQDIYKQLSNRYPLVELLLYPSLVQGEQAAGKIAHAINEMNRRSDIDVLIVGRGGGSIEDLSAFNEEIVARAIFNSTIPVVSAVGHETDFTISDMVADLRSSTPSAAIENIVPDRLELISGLNAKKSRLKELIKHQIKLKYDEIDLLSTDLSPSKRLEKIFEFSQTIDRLEESYHRVIGAKMGEKNIKLQALADQLDNLSPLGTLNRGYSICRDVSGEVITSSKQIKTGEKLDVKLSQGNLLCTVDECIEKNQVVCLHSNDE